MNATIAAWCVLSVSSIWVPIFAYILAEKKRNLNDAIPSQLFLLLNHVNICGSSVFFCPLGNKFLSNRLRRGTRCRSSSIAHSLKLRNK